MDSQLTEMFAHARHMVDEEDRRKQEDQQRRQDAEREALLHDLAQRVDAAFDFSSREKVELDPRMDVLEERGVLEFVVRGVRAIFLLTQKPQGGWMLQVAEDGQPVQSLIELPGGTREDPHSRRLSAARVISAIGDWAVSKEKPGANKRVQPIAQVAKPQQPPRPPANQDPGRRPPPPVPEFGKVFGY